MKIKRIKKRFQNNTLITQCIPPFYINRIVSAFIWILINKETRVITTKIKQPRLNREREKERRKWKIMTD